MRRAYVVGLVAVVALLSTGADDCSGGEESNDANKIDNIDTGAITISMPDGFTNVAAKCVGTDLLYAAKNDNGRAIAVSPGHPWCEDEVLTREEMDR